MLGRAATAAVSVLGKDGGTKRLFPDKRGELEILPRGGVVLRASGQEGRTVDLLTLDAGAVRAISLGRLTRWARALRPWTREGSRPTRIGQVVRGRRDLVLVLVREGVDGEERLWAFDLWRSPTPAERASVLGLASSPHWPPPVEAVVPPRSYRRLIRTARRSGEDAKAVWPGW